MSRLKYIIIFTIFFTSVITCKQDKSGASFMPKISGNAGEVVCVIESYHWQSELGEEIRKIFLVHSSRGAW